MKKLVLLGAVALVVLGCVIAAGCTSTPTTQQTTSKDNAISLPVGEWICMNYTTDEGKTITAIQVILADGPGVWLELNGSNPGFQIDRGYLSNFSKPDQNGAFEKASSTGKTHKMVYDAAKGTITQDGKNVYTKFDPIVGVWSGIAPVELGSGNSAIAINPKGTGVSDIFYDNGTSRVTKLTWTKNTDGTYAVVFNDGAKQTFTLASDGKTLKTADGRTKTKQDLDSVIMIELFGPWYSKESDRLMVFKGDGTGVGLDKKNEILRFIWKLTDIDKLAVTYTDGSGEDGSSLKGKTFEWTYDLDNDVFISSKGFTYIRPHESIEGKFTLS